MIWWSGCGLLVRSDRIPEAKPAIALTNSQTELRSIGVESSKLLELNSQVGWVDVRKPNCKQMKLGLSHYVLGFVLKNAKRAAPLHNPFYVKTDNGL
jgi:hypothetical protein